MQEGSAAKRDEQSAFKKKLIYEKAKELFIQHGYNRTTIADISKASGMSVGSIYHFYKNKEAILLEISMYMGSVEQWREAMKSQANQPYEPIFCFLLDYASEWERLGVELTLNIYRIFNKAFLFPNNTIKPLPSHQVLIRFIQLAQDTGTFDKTMPATEAAAYLFTVCRGLIHDWCLFQGSFSLVEKARGFLPRILKTFIL